VLEWAVRGKNKKEEKVNIILNLKVMKKARVCICLLSSKKIVPKLELLIFSSKAKWNLLSVLNTHTRLQKSG